MVTIIGLLVLMSNVSAGQWFNTEFETKDQFTVSYVKSNTSTDLFIVRFDRNNECNPEVGILSKVNKGTELPGSLDSKYQIKIDENTTWFTEKTNVTRINEKSVLFSMKSGYDMLNQIKEGTIVRNKMFKDSYYNFDLINSSKAINRASDLCRISGVLVNENAKYFDI